MAWLAMVACYGHSIMLIVALLFGTVGYTLMYAGVRGGPKGVWARKPWILWIEAFQQLNTEVATAKKQSAALAGALGIQNGAA